MEYHNKCKLVWNLDSQKIPSTLQSGTIHTIFLKNFFSNALNISRPLDFFETDIVNWRLISASATANQEASTSNKKPTEGVN